MYKGAGAGDYDTVTEIDVSGSLRDVAAAAALGTSSGCSERAGSSGGGVGWKEKTDDRVGLELPDPRGNSDWSGWVRAVGDAVGLGLAVSLGESLDDERKSGAGPEPASRKLDVGVPGACPAPDGESLIIDASARASMRAMALRAESVQRRQTKAAIAIASATTTTMATIAPAGKPAEDDDWLPSTANETASSAPRRLSSTPQSKIERAPIVSRTLTTVVRTWHFLGSRDLNEM